MAQLNEAKRNDAIIRSSPGFFLEWLLPQIENLSDYEANWHGSRHVTKADGAL